MATKSISPASVTSGVHKRRRRTVNDSGAHAQVPQSAVDDSPPPIVQKLSPPMTSGAGGGSSSFRNVSACNRCRLRKNRCDQRLPACLSCEKASVKCVGYDPITKREIPRSYVHYLETRSAYLESLLTANNISFSPAESFPDLAPPPAQVATTPTATSFAAVPEFLAPPPCSQQESQMPIDPALTSGDAAVPESRAKHERSPRNLDSLEDKKLDNLVSDIGLVSFAGASDPRYLGSVSGISFARVVFAAVKSSATSNSSGDQNGAAAAGGTSSGSRRFRPRIGSSTRIQGARGLGIGASGGSAREEAIDVDEDDDDTQMRDSFFGLHTKPTIKPAPFPDRALAERLISRYFEYANPQVPVLHRGEFNGVLDKIYGTGDEKLNGNVNGDGVNGSGYAGGHKEKYMLNIVCAIGAGIFLKGPNEASDVEDESESEDETKHEIGPGSRKVKSESEKKRKRPQKYYEPESYHASAVVYLESFLSQSKGGLEELQAVLLLAGYALLRPVSPGLWYIVGVAVRLAVDLGLHYEDSEVKESKKDGKEGRRQWSRELRRRLWWCVYSLDRLVSTCVGRPFGIADEVISTKFPSILDDRYIHPTTGITPPCPNEKQPSYKLIAHHYFRLRLLQSEILQVLQQQSHSFSFTSSATEVANPCINPPIQTPPYKRNDSYPAHHPYHLQTAFLRNFQTIQCWHKDIDRRLKEWIDTAPKSKDETGVSFSLEFLELNYWQAKIMLYRPCLSVPVLLAEELGGAGGHAKGRAAERGFASGKERASEEERVYLVVAEAGSKVLRLYRQLHRVHQVNYTFLATHHLFMAGISFLYAIWHSPLVRSRLSMDEVDFTILAATSVLGDLVDKCPPAEACRDAFERMSRATVQMCLAGKRGPMSNIIPSSTIMHHTSISGATGATARNNGQGSAYQNGGGEDHDEREPEIKFPEPEQESRLFKSEYAPDFTQMHRGPYQRQQQQQQHSNGNTNGNGYSAARQQHQQNQNLARRREPVRFDEGFRELFTAAQMQGARYQSHGNGNSNHNANHSPQHPQYVLSPTHPDQMTQQAFHPPLAYPGAGNISPHAQYAPHPHSPHAHSPHHQGSSPHQANSPHHQGHSPHHQANSPHHQGHSPHHQGHSPHHQGHSPHHQGHSPHQQGHSPHHQGHSPHQQGHSPHHQGSFHPHNYMSHTAGSSPPILAGPGLPCSQLQTGIDGEEMMIDPQLQYPLEGTPWGNLDMSTFGLGGLDWEGDAWSDSGSAAGGTGNTGGGHQGGMDLFDGFFFGGGSGGY